MSGLSVLPRLHPAQLSLLLLVELPFLGRQPLGRDETTSIEVARRHWGAYWELLRHLDAPLGLYYLLLRPFVAVSDGAFAARLPSLLGMVGAVAVLVLSVERRYGRTAATWTGLVLLANPGLWQFADLARPYSLALLTAAITVYVIVVSPQRTILYAVAAVLTVYLQLLFGLFLAAEGVLLLVQKRWRLLGALGAAGLLTLPLVAVASGETVMTAWIPLTSVSSLKDEVANLFGGHGPLTVLATVVYVGLAALALRRPDSRRLVLLGVIPAGVLALLGFELHLLGGRYALYVVLGIASGAGVLLAGVRSRPVQAGLGGLLCLMALASGLTELGTDYRQEDLRAAARYLTSHDAPGDALLYSPDWARPGMSYWLDHTPGSAPDDVAVRPGTIPAATGNLFLPELSSAEIEAAVRTRSRVWVVGYPGQDWRPTANLGGDVAEHLGPGWSTSEHVAFGQIELRLLQR